MADILLPLNTVYCLLAARFAISITNAALTNVPINNDSNITALLWQYNYAAWCGADLHRSGRANWPASVLLFVFNLLKYASFWGNARNVFVLPVKPTGYYTGCPRRNGQNFGRVFLMLNCTDITQNTYIQSWTVTEIMAVEKCGLLGCPRTVRRPWRRSRPVRMPGNETPLANVAMQWPWRDYASAAACVKCLVTLRTTMSASVFVVQFNGFMSLTSWFDVKYRY